MESWKLKPAGRSKPNAPCKKHPNHKQSPGVCSLCLSDKLSQLSNSSGFSSSSSKVARSPSSSSSSSYVSSLSSSNASSCSSPIVSYACDGRKTMRAFMKSRSMAFVSRRRKEEDEDGKKIIGGVKGGFWSKLLPRRSGKLMHSRTMRERVTIAVH